MASRSPRIKVENEDSILDDDNQPRDPIEQALLKMGKWADEWLLGKYDGCPKETRDLAWNSFEYCLNMSDVKGTFKVNAQTVFGVGKSDPTQSPNAGSSRRRISGNKAVAS